MRLRLLPLNLSHLQALSAGQTQIDGIPAMPDTILGGLMDAGFVTVGQRESADDGTVDCWLLSRATNPAASSSLSN